MKYLVSILLILGFIGPAFGQSMADISDKIWLPNCPIGTSIECDQSSLFPDAIALPFLQSDSVAIGTIVEKDSKNQDSIRYSIDVDFYLKNYQPFDLIAATLNDAPEPQTLPEVFWYNSPIFNEGDLVFVYLKKIEGGYRLLPESFALDKHEVRGPPPTIHWNNSPSEDVFDQGEKILVSGEVRKMDLVNAVKDGKQLDAKLMLAKPQDRDNMVFSDIMQIGYDGIYNYSLDTSKIPPGNYELEVNYGPSTFGNGITILPNFKIWTPLKQISVGILMEEIQCRENLVLVQKYDGSPACVKPETKLKLDERRWTENKITYSYNPLKQKWTLTTNGEISSIDISKDDSIIAVGTKISGIEKGMLYLLEDDGTLLWKKEFNSMISHVEISNNTILVNGFHICGGGGGARTHCNYTADVFDIQGNKKYSVTHNDMTSFGASLSPNGNKIITHTYDNLNYFNFKENVSWKQISDKSIRQAIFLTDSILLVNTDNTGETIALDNARNKLWDFTTNYPSNYSFASSNNGKYFVVSDYASPDDGNIYLLDYNGNLLWQANTGNTVLHLEFSGDNSHILAEINGAFMVYDMQGNLLWKNNIPSDLTMSSDASFLLGTTFNQGSGASITMFNGKGNILSNNPTGNDSLSAVFDLADNDDYFVIANDTNRLVMFEISPDFDKIDYDLTDLRNSDDLHVMIVPKMHGLFDVTIAKGDSIEIPWDVKFDQGFTRSNFDVSIISDSGIESQITPTSPYVTINGKPPGEKIITIHPKADALTGNYTVKILGRGDTVHNQTGWMTNLDGKTLGTINVNVISK